jgi:hypothetical protein
MFTAFSLLVVAIASALLGKRYGAAAEKTAVADLVQVLQSAKKDEKAILAAVKTRVGLYAVDAKVEVKAIEADVKADLKKL